MRPDTRVVHGDPRPDGDSALAPSIHPSATFIAGDAEDFARMASQPRHDRYYTRYGNPTHERTAALIAELEGGETALLTASGMGAISTTVLALVGQGDHVVAQTSHYMGTTRLLTDLLPRFGATVSLVDQADAAAFAAAIRPGTTLVLVETPANPTLALTDIRAVAAAARRVGARVVADNTFATPLNQRPLDLGADIVVHSATKYLGGHHDLTAGAIVTSSVLAERIWSSAIVLGATLGPHDAWLLLRGLRTLALRVERSNHNALAVARHLARHPDVVAVHHPGLESHPQHRLALEQMTGFGGVVAVRIAGGYAGASRFVSRLRLFTHAVSLGGVESLVVHAAAMWAGTLDDDQMRLAGVEPDLVRLALGIEATEDLIADLDQALSA